jgi:DNA-binding LacI/PurR family transcriptional regulator
MATLKEISRLTNVNIGTVSHVLNNHPKAKAVREETRKRIFEAAVKLGYRRNEVATSIRTGINRTVALIGDFAKTGSIHTNAVISGILASATRSDYGIKVYSAEQLGSCLDDILGYKIGSIIVTSLSPDCRVRVAEFCQRHDLTAVFVFEEGHEAFPAINSDDRTAMRNAVSELFRLGHRRIALLCAEHNYRYMRARHDGYLDGLAEAGIPVDKQIVDCSLRMRDSVLAVNRMLDLPESGRPTAFLCIADTLAVNAINQTFLRGLRVPEDVSVIGFGNAQMLCDTALVPLSSINQPFEEMGEAALKLAIECKAPPSGEVLLPTTMVQRRSVSACGRRHG